MNMPEEASAIDVYYDMDIAQICQHFNKSRNTVDKAIAKLLFLVKNTPTKIYPIILEKHLKIYTNALNLPLKFSSTNLLGI